MPSRSDELRVIDPVLTQVAMGYSNEAFIGERLFPIVNVEKSAGKIPKWGKESFQVFDTDRALRAKSNRIEPKWFTTTPFETSEHDLEIGLDYLELREAMLNLEMLSTNQIMELISLGREKKYADIAQDLDNYEEDNQDTLSDDFYNEDDIDFIADIGNKCDDLSNLIGKYPNLCIIGQKVWRNLRFQEIFKTYLGVSVAGTALQTIKATAEKLAELLEVKEVIIGRSKYTTDKVNLENIWGNNIILAYVVDPPSGIERTPYEPCYGYTLRLKTFPNSDTYMENGGKIKVVRTSDNYDIKIVGSASALIINQPIDPAIYTPGS